MLTALAAGPLDRPAAVVLAIVALLWTLIAIVCVARGDRRG